MKISNFTFLSCSQLLLLVLFSLAGCGGTSATFDDPRGMRAMVHGSVDLNGKPLDRAIIRFRAAEGENRVISTGTIIDGEYQIAAKDGPLIGKMRVEIEFDNEDELEHSQQKKGQRQPQRKRRVLPACYNKKSVLTANVSKDSEQNQFDFHLKTR